MRIGLLLSACLFWLNAQAAPLEVATLDRSVWPERLESGQLFNVASRGEILSFAHELYLSEGLDENALKARLSLRQVNLPSINVIRGRMWTRLLNNYQNAKQDCVVDASFCVLVDDLPMFRERASEFTVADDSFYAPWAAPAARFNRVYLNELLRMAALFPQTGSEIERYNSDELSGEELPDASFMLNFESGPTAAGGATDWLADFMRQQKMNAVFFVLGKNLQARLDATPVAELQRVYRGQCVGIQGWEYRSHSYWVDWQDSILRAAALARGNLPDAYVPLFRPPYGHRRADSASFLRGQGIKVSLFNIDAQDASPGLRVDQSVDRVVTLMLLWRHGQIVFRDASDKAQSIVPQLMASTQQSEVKWHDCHDYPAAEPAPKEDEGAGEEHETAEE